MPLLFYSGATCGAGEPKAAKKNVPQIGNRRERKSHFIVQEDL
jgi:hypothetical protein